MSEDLARVLKLLEKTGYDSKPAEFKATLDKFKAHPEALDALRKGVARHGRNEDRGSYCENASAGYGDWYKKHKMLEEIDLEDDRVFLQNADPAALARKFQPAATPAVSQPAPAANQPAPAANQNDVVEELREQVRELTRRVSKLETQKYKLKPGAP
ncbi:MAG: hypothetical protein PW788_00985 [Micavibrio sp.]|nr:hypothetical protein [Micavibrio sp.]